MIKAIRHRANQFWTNFVPAFKDSLRASKHWRVWLTYFLIWAALGIATGGTEGVGETLGRWVLPWVMIFIAVDLYGGYKSRAVIKALEESNEELAASVRKHAMVLVGLHDALRGGATSADLLRILDGGSKSRRDVQEGTASQVVVPATRNVH